MPSLDRSPFTNPQDFHVPEAGLHPNLLSRPLAIPRPAGERDGPERAQGEGRIQGGGTP
jgi:hypothetical protein